MRLRTSKWLWIIIAVWWVLSGAVLAAAKGYPRQEDPHVNDYAGVIAQRDLQQIRTMLVDLKQQSGIDATVLTIHSINDYDSGDQNIEFFANRLFDTWGIGDRVTNKGVLLLVAVKDRKVRIELGKSYRDLYDARMKEVIDRHILPAFRENDHTRGILQGTQGIIRVLSGTPISDAPRTPAKFSTRRPRDSGGLDLVVLFGVLGLTGVGFGALFLIDRLRYGSFFPRKRTVSTRRDGNYYGDYHDYSDSGGSYGGGGGSSDSGGGSSGGGGATGDW